MQKANRVVINLKLAKDRFYLRSKLQFYISNILVSVF